MRSKYLLLLPVFAAALMMFNSALSEAARKEHGHGSEQIVKVGKNVQWTFDKETRVGDLTLKPGRYVLQHRVNGADHFIQFTEWTKRAHVGDATCRLEPLDEKTQQTSFFLAKEGNAQRLVKITIAGENVAHVF